MAIAYLHFFSFITYVYLTIYVLALNPREELNRACAAILVCFMLWSAHYLFRNAPGAEKTTAHLAICFGAIGWMGLAPSVLWFSLLFTEHETLIRRPLVKIGLIAPAVVLWYGQYQKKIISDLTWQSHGWANVWSHSIWTYSFIAYLTVCMPLALSMFHRYAKNTSSPSKKKQSYLLLISTASVYFFGTATDVVAPIAGFAQIPPMADILMLGWAASLTYTILRYKLMTISPATAAENIIAAMSDLLILTDPQLRIKTVNSATLECLGYDKKAIEGLRFTKLLWPEGSPEGSPQVSMDDAFDNQLNTYKIHNRCLRFKTRTGHALPVIISSSPLVDQQDRSVGVVVVARDISEMVKREETLRQLETQLNKAKRLEAIGTLAGGVAHDLNNILGGLVSYPDLILHQLSGNDPLRSRIETIKRSGEKAAAIVEDLLTMARRGVRNTSVADLNTVISEFMQSPEYLKLHSCHPEVSVTVDYQDDLQPVDISCFHISKMLMNLVANAFEALPNGGAIRIKTENRTLTFPEHGYETIPKGSYTTICLTDNGLGIARDDLEHIFEPFFTKKKMGRSGTGLGMSVVWGSVKDHLGYIDLQSQVGRGTRVTVYLPAARQFPDHAPASAVLAPVCSGNREHILVVDDVPEQRALAADILKSLDYRVTVVSSGEQAVEFVKKHRVDLVLLDMLMAPGIDGLETYQRIIKIHPGQKAVIASGFAKNERVKQAIDLGVHSYIKKPYNIEDIAAVLHSALQ